MRDPLGVGNPSKRTIARLMLDRTAVLTVGLLAGFTIGLSFAPSEKAVRPTATPDRSRAAEIAESKGVVLPPVQDVVDPRVLRRVAANGGTLRVGVFGDSFGVGVWDGLYRQLPSEEGFEVLRFSKEGTGFTRYSKLNLEERAIRQLSKDPVDVAVISFGANDANEFYEHGHLYPLMSAGWLKIVGERVDRFVAVARSTGAKVYWVGLPAMRDPVLDANIMAMNRLYASHMQKLGVPFVDSRPLSVGPDGRYAAHLPDEKGTPRLMRTPDGLHMIGIGYQRITRSVVQRIRTDAQRARAGKPFVEEQH